MSLDNLESIFLINNEEEMNSKITDNLFKIETILNDILLRIKERYIPENEINKCIK